MRAPDDLDSPLGDERSRTRAVADVFRKVMVSGVGALFMTEEGIRSAVKELKLPKDALSAALAQAEKTKADLVRMLGTELRTFLQSAKLREELLDALSKVRLEVHAEIAFKPVDGTKRKGNGRKKAPSR